VAAADLLWSPSEYLLGWTRDKGFVHPPQTYLQKYVLPSLPLFGPPRQGAVEPTSESQRPSEIVFFGRLEERKGLRLFCDALRRIEPVLVEQGASITFLGKPGSVGDRPALEFLEEEAAGWSFAWQARTELGQQDAVAYLREPGRLAVIASPADNSPCTVYEAVGFGIRFIAARTGGIPELIDEDDRGAILFDADPQSLADRLRAALGQGLKAARPAETREASRRKWIGAFAAWRDFVGPPPAAEPERRLIALIDGPDGADLAATLGSLQVPEVTKTILIDRRWPAQAGNTMAISPLEPDRLVQAVGDSAGEAVLLLRAGTVLLPGAGRRLVEALRLPEVDGLVPAASANESGAARIIAPLGACRSFCLYEGASPGGAMIIKSERLAGALAGGTLAPDAEHLGLGDLAVAAGLDIWPLAETLIAHPDGPVADARSRRAPERICAYAAAADPTDRLYMTAIGYGGFAPDHGVGGWLRQWRDRLATRGLGWATAFAVRLIPRGLLSRLRAPRR
jgi:hypothetical protein